MEIEYKKTIAGLREEDLKGFFVGWRNPLTTQQHLEILKNSSHVILAYDNESKRVIGFINALSDKVNFAFIPMIEVIPEYQRYGVGKKLLEGMLEDLKDITCIDLTCDEKMQSFYEKFGMKKSNGMVIRKYI